ncbi:putative membrane protein [Citrobacter rodentium ICC168]|uniref:Membrane protein n=1 Tax=Citrobacter rodentium (strain ICC168) TaxID=637910 RepID=D2TT31_CITRI|nr:putative membrane protein [Citrobacter rodentium ICC168]
MHSLTFFAVAPFKNVNYRREKENAIVYPLACLFSFINNSFIFKLVMQVTFNVVAQSCNMIDISR